MEEIADALARDVLRAVEELGDENLVTEISRVIGSSSTTTQEAFMTAIRVRMSEQRARRLLAEKVGADWPLAAGSSGSDSVPQLALLAQMATALAERPAAVPVAAPRQEAIRPEPEPVRAPDPKPLPPVMEPVEAAASSEAAESQPELAESLPEPQSDPQDPLRVRPKIPAPPPQVKPAPSAPAPRSLEAALALATSLPRKVVAPVEPSTPVVNPYADIEMPDGDWG